MEQWIVNISGLTLIGLIIWWFWLSKPDAQRLRDQVVEIIVDNGTYTPSRIEVKTGETARLRFRRKDASPCAEKVEFPDFDLSVDLPLNEQKEIRLTPHKAGEYSFHCQMQMYQGSLVVK